MKKNIFRFLIASSILSFLFLAEVNFASAEDSSSSQNQYREPVWVCSPSNPSACCWICELLKLPICGNGKVEAGEECDDKLPANSNGKLCGLTCKWEPVPESCGDGVTQSPEQCDEGSQNSNTGACTTSCQSAHCGDGYVQTSNNEVCDDGNNSPGDGCSSSCQSELNCGNGIVEPPEECDDGNKNDGDGCSANCAEEGMCGNGIIDGDDVCDNGAQNGQPGNDCDINCHAVNLCGNGMRDAGEGCDDGNSNYGDGCSDTCQEESFSAACTPETSDNAHYSGSCSLITSNGQPVAGSVTWVASSSNVSVCENPQVGSGASPSFNGNFVFPRDLGQSCVLTFTATPSGNFSNPSATATVNIQPVDTCVQYTDSNATNRTAENECVDGATFTCSTGWTLNDSDGNCVCTGGTMGSC